MKVTDAMVDRVCDELSCCDTCDDGVRGALEAALADVPDQPVHGYVPDVQFLRMQAKCIGLEAKLAKVRAYAHGQDMHRNHPLFLILDGE